MMVNIFEEIESISSGTDTNPDNLESFARETLFNTISKYLQGLLTTCNPEVFRKNISLLDGDCVARMLSLLVQKIDETLSLTEKLQCNYIILKCEPTEKKEPIPNDKVGQVLSHRNAGLTSRRNAHLNQVSNFGKIYNQPLEVIQVECKGEHVNTMPSNPPVDRKRVGNYSFTKVDGKTIHCGKDGVVLACSDFSMKTFFKGAYSSINTSAINATVVRSLYPSIANEKKGQTSKKLMQLETIRRMTSLQLDFSVAVPELHEAVTNVTDVVFKSSVCMSRSIGLLLDNKLAELKIKMKCMLLLFNL